jgi:Zn-finger nucleic acid-binding protein
MQCPVDTDTALVMSERQGVEIDYCPKCRGVWLDRGELDKIIDRANELMAPAAAPTVQPTPAAPAPPPPTPGAPPPNPQMQSYQSGYPGSPKYGHGYDGKRKKKGFLGEMFDF